MERRKFIKICTIGGVGSNLCLTAAVAGDTKPAAKSGVVAQPKRYARVKLVDEDGRAIKAKSLKRNHNYVFNYPFESTPCFLLSLNQAVKRNTELVLENGDSYLWQGGVGNDNRIVAYSAICAHKLAYPSSQVSFISFRDQPSPLSPTGNVIGCCADKSAYDPASGARVIGGPAPQPLATILLEYDAKKDELFAVGTMGGERFDAFFQKYAFKLSLEKGGTRAKEKVTATSVVRDLSAHSRQTAQC
jgi:arsenite oxidase small subunit